MMNDYLLLFKPSLASDGISITKIAERAFMMLCIFIDRPYRPTPILYQNLSFPFLHCLGNQIHGERLTLDLARNANHRPSQTLLPLRDPLPSNHTHAHGCARAHANIYIYARTHTHTFASRFHSAVVFSQIGVQIKASEVGIIIGPKGAHIHMLQDATNTKVTTPQQSDARVVTVFVEGPAEGVKRYVNLLISSRTAP